MEQLANQQSASLTQTQTAFGKLEETSLALHNRTQETLNRIMTSVDEAPYMSRLQFDALTAVLRRLEAKLNQSYKHQNVVNYEANGLTAKYGNTE